MASFRACRRFSSASLSIRKMGWFVWLSKEKPVFSQECDVY
jgi:hypothetical protein